MRNYYVLTFAISVEYTYISTEQFPWVKHHTCNGRILREFTITQDLILRTDHHLQIDKKSLESKSYLNFFVNLSSRTAQVTFFSPGNCSLSLFTIVKRKKKMQVIDAVSRRQCGQSHRFERLKRLGNHTSEISLKGAT